MIKNRRVKILLVSLCFTSCVYAGGDEMITLYEVSTKPVARFFGLLQSGDTKAEIAGGLLLASAGAGALYALSRPFAWWQDRKNEARMQALEQRLEAQQTLIEASQLKAITLEAQQAFRGLENQLGSFRSLYFSLGIVDQDGERIVTREVEREILDAVSGFFSHWRTLNEQQKTLGVRPEIAARSILQLDAQARDSNNRVDLGETIARHETVIMWTFQAYRSILSKVTAAERIAREVQGYAFPENFLVRADKIVTRQEALAWMLSDENVLNSVLKELKARKAALENGGDGGAYVRGAKGKKKDVDERVGASTDDDSENSASDSDDDKKENVYSSTDSSTMVVNENARAATQKFLSGCSSGGRNVEEEPC